MRGTMTIEVGPLPIHFTNVNKAMALPGHSHGATVSFGMDVLGPLGFPVFAHTVAPVEEALAEATRRPFRDHTNEDVLGALANVVAAALERGDPDGAGTAWQLAWVELAVQGVQDQIGHHPSTTRYRLRASGNVAPHTGTWPRPGVPR